MIIVNPEKRRDGKSSFGALVKYIESGDYGESKLLFSGVRGLAIEPKDTEEIIKEFHANAALNKRNKDPVFHTIISWKEGEIPTKEQIQGAIDIYLHEVDMEKCHCFYGAHKNTKNIHIHLCISRIDPETQLSVAPAAGWTKKANVRASRRIEMEQGWERDPGGMYQVIGNEIIEIISEKKDSAINKKARDFENFTSEKSAIRYVKDNCTDMLFKNSSWGELHKNLATHGVQLKKKGSGCVLEVGEIVIKLSSVSQQLSLSKLEKRLGTFESKGTDIQMEEYKPESLRKMPDSEKYRQERDQFNAYKKETKTQFAVAFKKEFSELINQQKGDRKKLYESQESWKGKGVILNILKSRLAWEHVQQKRELKERQSLKKKELQVNTNNFPSFTEWLRGQNKNLEADQWRYRETLPMAITGLGNEYAEPQKTKSDTLYEIEVEPWAGKKESLMFRNRRDQKRIAFVDLGRRIDVVNWRDEQTVLDALTLAQEKWGKCLVHGSEQYKKLCVNIAAKHNINLVNPELQSQLKMEKEALIEKRKEMEKMTSDVKRDFTRYHNAIGANRYRVTAFWNDDKGNHRGWVLDKKKNDNISRGFTPGEVLYNAALIEKLDLQGKNVYYTPISENKHHILVDDLTKDSLQQLLKDGYKPAIILESSPGNFQVILNISKISDEFDRDVSNKLMVDLNTQYGDPKIQGAIHPHRIPGTHNTKEKHKREDGTFPQVRFLYAEAVDCRKSYAQSFEIHKMLSQAKKTMLEARQKEQEKKLQEHGEARLLSPVDAYNAHAKNIMQHAGAGGITNWNRIDSMIAVRMHVTGYSRTDIQEAIEHAASTIRPEEDKNKHKWPNYAKQTATFPDSPRGQMQIHEFGSKYHDHWLRIEGRLPERQKKEREIER